MNKPNQDKRPLNFQGKSQHHVRHFIDIADISAEDIHQLIGRAKELKKHHKAGTMPAFLSGKTLGLYFEKPSLRTRVSFEVGMLNLGGNCISLSKKEVGLGQREPVKDVARVLSRFVDVMMMRLYQHEQLKEFAQHAQIPVINGLTDHSHPCQALADIVTVSENVTSLKGRVLCYIGDGNNVARSLAEICEKTGMIFRQACPKGYELKGIGVEVHHNALEGARHADVVYTDVWASMGQEDEELKRNRDFAQFTVTDDVMKAANPTALFLHCLPAHRGQEVTDEVMESPQSKVFDQAENRMHAQNAVLLYCLESKKASSL